MGLPGSGKTTLAKMIAPRLNAVLLNADEVRKEADDWDFSYDGRLRQILYAQLNKQEQILKQIIQYG